MHASTECSLCGPVTVSVTEMMFHPDDNVNWYGFRCPVCAIYVWRTANQRVARLLCALGVPGRPSGIAGPITESELRDFASGLDHGWPAAEFDDVA